MCQSAVWIGTCLCASFGVRREAERGFCVRRCLPHASFSGHLQLVLAVTPSHEQLCLRG